MRMIDIHFLEIPIAALLIAITVIHAGIFTANKKIGRWFHIIWGGIYCGFVILLSLAAGSWWLLGIGALMRFAFYNPLLNAWRLEPIFYLSTSSGADSSWWDRIELNWGIWYPVICTVSAIFFITLQFFFYE